MQLIVDANIVIAALVGSSTVRKLLFLSNVEFVTLKFLQSEIERHKKELLEKMGISEVEFQEAIALVLSKIRTVEDSTVRLKLAEADEIMRDIDPDDVKYIALALSIENDGIWSNDKHFIRQRKIKVWRTKDLLKYID